MGEPTTIRLEEGSAAAGKSLSALGVRGRTGATVLVISRPGQPVLLPAGHEVLRPGDVLAMCGSREAIEAARGLLAGEDGEARASPSPAVGNPPG
jgi:CPA2 family monovalent cation:H+ antiporter-2